jgi:hypothetical protein
VRARPQVAGRTGMQWSVVVRASKTTGVGRTGTQWSIVVCVAWLVADHSICVASSNHWQEQPISIQNPPIEECGVLALVL